MSLPSVVVPAVWPPAMMRVDELTPTEVDILRGCANGETIIATAERRYCAPETIKYHRGNILCKLGALNSAHAVAIALRQGLLADPARPGTTAGELAAAALRDALARLEVAS